MQDTTATHLIRALEAQTHMNQRRVNEWLINELAPLRAGNAAIADSVQLLSSRISKLEKDLGPTGRIRKANTVRLNNFRQQRLNALAQRASNISNGVALIEVAIEAIDTWHRYFEAQAAIYVRARALKNKRQPPAAVAAVPSIQSVELIEVPDFLNPEDMLQEGAN